MIMNSYCRVHCLHDAYDMLQDMKSKEIQPDIITYIVLLDGNFKKWKRCSFSFKSKRKKETMNVITVITKMELKCDVSYYTILIDKHCKTDNLQNAILLFNKMIERGLNPNIMTYAILLSGFYNRGDVERVKILIGEMYSKGI